MDAAIAKLILPGPTDPDAVSMLFDLSSDPQEKKILAALPNYAGAVAQLQTLLDRCWSPPDDSAVTR